MWYFHFCSGQFSLQRISKLQITALPDINWDVWRFAKMPILFHAVRKFWFWWSFSDFKGWHFTKSKFRDSKNADLRLWNGQNWQNSRFRASQVDKFDSQILLCAAKNSWISKSLPKVVFFIAKFHSFLQLFSLNLGFNFSKSLNTSLESGNSANADYLAAAAD